MLSRGDLLTLDIEKPAAGGRMIGRVEGRVVLVSGAIPGERLSARVERVSRGVAYAAAETVIEASPDRRPAPADPQCGGCLYAHIAYSRQLAIKSLVVADACSRLGKLELAAPVTVMPSPEDGYRMRARLHLRGPRIGFFREGTHDLCDVKQTRQLLPDTVEVADRLAAGLRSLGVADGVEMAISENLDASERVAHVQAGEGRPVARLDALARTDGLTGLTAADGRSARVTVVSGSPYVVDRLRFDAGVLSLRRHVLSFFQGNRHLLGRLIEYVSAQVSEGCEAVDLYAGGGAFAVAAAALRGARVRAVEGDPVAAADLVANAEQAGSGVVPLGGAVETIELRGRAADVVIVDPPRTGMSKAALEKVVGLAGKRIVYVSCDVATFARDARRLVDAGYRLASLDGFDLFPNTPHVETVGVFERS